MAPDMVLKFYISVAKGLHVKVWKFWWLIHTFVEVTGEKLLGGGLFDPPSWIGLNLILIIFPKLTNDFFSISLFFHECSRITEMQGKGEGISLTPHYHFHQLRGGLDISRVIAAGGSPLRIAGSRTRTGNLWFPSASR